MIKLNAVLHDEPIPISFEVAKIDRNETITIDRMVRTDGSVLWSIVWIGYVFNKGGEWEYDPLPSSRDDEFLARCRWDSFDAAVAMAKIAAQGRIDNAQVRVDAVNARMTKESAE